MTSTLRKLSLACLCALPLAPSAATAQTDRPADSPASSAPRLLDTYGDIMCDDLLARLDHLAVMLLNEPEAGLHVFVYGDREEVERRVLAHIEFTKERLTGWPKMEARRVHVRYGGRREEFTVEPYLVPKGASPPPPTPTVEAPDARRAPRKFDEGRFGFERDARGRAALLSDTEVMCPLELVPDLAGYARALRAAPDARAHVVVYGGQGQRYGDVNTLSRLIRHRLFTVERIPHRRITLVYGGRLDRPFVELWLVPRGARPPSVSRQ